MHVPTSTRKKIAAIWKRWKKCETYDTQVRTAAAPTYIVDDVQIAHFYQKPLKTKIEKIKYVYVFMHSPTIN